MVRISIILVDGELLAWGDNTYGELGTEKGLFIEHPQKVVFFAQKIKKITTGARHSLVIDEFNKVYAFGDNSEGQCTNGGTRIVNPTPIHFESKDMIIDIFSGYSHCVIMTGII
jgi:alpha-tubulin suppressor-like RCC1 family protein